MIQVKRKIILFSLTWSWSLMSSSADTRVFSWLRMFITASFSSSFVPAGSRVRISFFSSGSSWILPCLHKSTEMIVKQQETMRGDVRWCEACLHCVVDRLATPFVTPIRECKPGFGEVRTLHCSKVKQTSNDHFTVRYKRAFRPFSWKTKNSTL